ncbi:MAG: glycosyltransferase [Patescibacteria group bacterium]
MLQKVEDLKNVSSKEVLGYATGEHAKEIEELAKSLRGKRVLHINATPQGGGVAEILKSLIPYLRAFGVEAEWYAFDPAQAPSGFFGFTNRLHNALQGEPTEFYQEEWATYERVGQQVAAELDEIPHDVLVVHDPQPLPAARFLSYKLPRILFIHIDTVNPQKGAWGQVLPFVEEYDQVVFSNEEFVNSHISRERFRVFQPAIDPLAAKQRMVPQEEARSFLVPFGIPREGSLVVQVSRFDIWKNPSGVVEAFRIARQNCPGTKLALVGFQEAKDNPEATKVYERVKAMAQREKDIFLFFDPEVLAGSSIGEFTMMVQNAADVVVQNSIREGFGLTATEAMWKGKAVVGGPASGIQKQIIRGENGLIAVSVEELAASLEYMLTDKEARARLGTAAKESVRKSFLMPRLLLDHLRLYKELVSPVEN